MKNGCKIRLAIVGCGAVTRNYHLPAASLLSSQKEIEVTYLIDRDITKAKNLAKRFGVENYDADYKKCIDSADAAILAVPHSLHAPIAVELLKNGIHILCEKPLALTVEQALDMIEASRANNRRLAVGYYRRFIPAANLMKTLVANRVLGRILSIEAEEGFIYNWPVETFSFWDRAQSGGGVLMDTGSHMLDLILWWLGWPKQVSILEYDDALGGVEATAKLSFIASIGENNIPVSIKLSRLRKLNNFIRVHGENLTAVFKLSTPDRLILEFPSDSQLHRSYLISHDQADNSFISYFVAQLRAFLKAITCGNDSSLLLANGNEAIQSLQLIELAYQSKKNIPKPWLPSPIRMLSNKSPLAGKTILVTGASGFLGGWIVEKLWEANANVRACIHNISHAARLARLPITMVKADMTDRKSLEEAIEGCDFVIHCAFSNAGNSKEVWRANVSGMRNLVEVMLRKGVKRFVHLSSIAVYYGNCQSGFVDEKAPLKRTGITYCDTKIELEKIALRFYEEAGLPTVVLRPGNIYGPYSPLWTLHPLERIKKGLPVLINGGQTPSNTVYVGNVVNAVLLSLVSEQATGKVFNVTESFANSKYQTWKDFYNMLASLLPEHPPVLSVDEEQINRLKRQALKKFLYEIMKAIPDETHGLLIRIVNRVKHSPGSAILQRYLPTWLISYLRKQSEVQAWEGNEGSIAAVRQLEELHSLYIFDKLYRFTHTIPSIYSATRLKEILSYEPIGIEDAIEQIRAYLIWEGYI